MVKLTNDFNSFNGEMSWIWLSLQYYYYITLDIKPDIMVWISIINLLVVLVNSCFLSVLHLISYPYWIQTCIMFQVTQFRPNDLVILHLVPTLLFSLIIESFKGSIRWTRWQASRIRSWVNQSMFLFLFLSPYHVLFMSLSA